MKNKEALQLLKESVQINTVYGNERELADKIKIVLFDNGFEIEEVSLAKNRTQLIATLKGTEDGPVLAFSGHLDVVPVGEVKWDDDPFSAIEKDGKIYGRGSTDMKSGLISAIAGVIRMKNNGRPIKGTLKLVITAGEETSSIGAAQLVELGYVDDVDAMIINEPTDLKIGVAHKGALWIRITAYGKSAHGSMPHKGVNAITQLIKLVNKITKDERFKYEKFTDDTVGRSTKSLNVFNGGKGTNVLPDQAVLEYDIRTIVSQDHKKIKNDFETLLKEMQNDDLEFKYDLEFFNDLVAVKTEEDNPFVDIVREAVETVLEESTIKNPAYYTDGSKFVLSNKDFPIIILGPGQPELAHQPNEYVEIEQFYNMIEINKKIAELYLNK